MTLKIKRSPGSFESGSCGKPGPIEYADEYWRTALNVVGNYLAAAVMGKWGNANSELQAQN